MDLKTQFAQYAIYAAYEVELIANEKPGERMVMQGVTQHLIEAIGNIFSDECYHLEFKDAKLLLKPLTEFTNDEWMQVFTMGLETAITPLPSDFLHAFKTLERHDQAIEILIHTNSRPNSIVYEFDNLSFDTKGIRFNQFNALTTIAKLKGDLFGWIDQGKALNINTLPAPAPAASKHD